MKIFGWQVPKMFIGFTNVKFLIVEFIKMYSNQPSFFSQKRVNMAIAFFSGIGVILCYVWSHRHILSNPEMIADASLLLGSAYYGLKKIQEEKFIGNKDNGDASTSKD